MRRIHPALVAGLALTVVILQAGAAMAATKLRRPFVAEKSFNYGFDNNGSAAGCSDHECGSRCYNGHGGTDYPLSLGTDVLAPATGTVVATNDGCANYGGLGNTCGGGCGNYVKIQVADGHFVLFCHMQAGSLKVSKGQGVSCGQVVGRSASSGNSSGPHLHLGWRTSGNTNIASYKGPCSSQPSAWVDQGSYWGATSAQCECVAGSESCNGKDDDCDGKVDEDDVCERAALLSGQAWVAPARTTDIDGDGRADVCGRGAAGVWCHLSLGASWSAKGPTLPLADAQGWDDPTNWGTLRMGDLDGDERADLCARANAGIVCWKSDGTSLTTKIDGPGWSDDTGWSGFQFHSTLRLLDVDADGKDDLCARAAKGIVCLKSTGDGFSEPFDGPAWSDAAGFAVAKHYGTLRVGDVDGDGREDLCIRAAAGMQCQLSDGSGFPTKVEGPAWSDASGWGDMRYWTSIRLADVDGDGRADLCARDSQALRCHFSQGGSFSEAVQVAPLADANGWADASNHQTLRSGDVDGDGAQELCIRADAKILCYDWNGSGFDSFDGPAWSDDDGWNQPEHFHTIQLGDVDGDGKADLCGRHSSGWRCHPSTGKGFGEAMALDELTDAGGWSAERYYATIQLGGPRCIAREEVCNGEDDDCDGEVDEGACGSDAGTGGWGTGGTAPTTDAGTASSAGVPATGGASSEVESNQDLVGESGCGCRTPARSPTSQGPWVMVAGAAIGLWRSRRASRARSRGTRGRPGRT